MPAGGLNAEDSRSFGVGGLSIVLAEDSLLLREGLASILDRAGHHVRDAVGDAETLVAVVRKDPPDVVITDVRMPPGHSDEGLRAAAAIRADHPAVGILVLSQYVADAYLPALLESTGGGGIGYLLKDRVGHVAEFLASLDRVASGGTVVDPEVVRQLLSRRKNDGPLAALTPRELEVLAFDGRGPGQLVDRGRVGGERGGGAEARGQHLRQARLVGWAGSTGVRRTDVSAGDWVVVSTVGV